MQQVTCRRNNVTGVCGGTDTKTLLAGVVRRQRFLDRAPRAKLVTRNGAGAPTPECRPALEQEGH